MSGPWEPVTPVLQGLRGCLALLRDWCLILALILLASLCDSRWVMVVCVVAIGIVQFALGEALLHEASHRNLLRGHRRANDLCGALCALPFFTTLADWRREHMQHHRHFGTAADHIVEDYAAHRLIGPSPRVGWVWFGKPLLGMTSVRHVLGLAQINSPGGWLHVAAFWAPVVAICWLSNTLDDLAVFWLVPQFTVFATLLHWSEIADHYRTRSGSRSRIGWFHNWMFHNNGYHAAHHRFPALSFSQLPQAHLQSGETRADVARGWWGAWKQISRPRESVPQQWAAFWPSQSD